MRAIEATPEIRNGIASRWMQRGIVLLNENTTASLTASLRCFEKAIDSRRSLPLPENPSYRYDLAAAWMNRADALTRLGSSKNLAEAIRSYDEALALLQTLELANHPSFRKRLAVAWMNRGITLQAQQSAKSLRAALSSFDQAIAILRTRSPEHHLILACALTNRSNALLEITLPDPPCARESAEEALVLIAAIEKRDRLAAETGLKARHIFCRAVASQLAERPVAAAAENSIAAVTDAVEEGMKLARHWEMRGERRFRELAAELFRFGARVYQMHQSHFLSEFLLDHLDAFPSDANVRAAAGDAIARAVDDIQRDGFSALNTPRFDRLLQTLRQLRIAQERLDAANRLEGRDLSRP